MNDPNQMAIILRVLATFRKRSAHDRPSSNGEVPRPVSAIQNGKGSMSRLEKARAAIAAAGSEFYFPRDDYEIAAFSSGRFPPIATVT